MDYTERHLDLLYKNASLGIVVDVVVGFVIATACWIKAPSHFPAIWFVALCLGIWARILFARRYERTLSANRCLRRQLASYSLVSVYMGATWGSLGLFGALNHSLGYQLLIIFVLLGIGVRALATKGAFLPAYLDFLLPLFLLPILGFLMQANTTGNLMALLLIAIVAAFYQCSRQVNRIVASAIALSVEKDGLVAQLMTAHEDERKRIAAELHDGIGQSLSAVKFSLENEVTKLRRIQLHEEALLALEAVVQRIREAIGELRQVATGLRPTMLDDLGILSTLDWLFRTYQDTHPEINVAKRYVIEECDIPQELKVVIYRIVQEALNNIAKHAGADQVTIQLEKITSAIHLFIEDNGQGFKPSARENPGIKGGGGLGLTSMRERAESVGGEFKLTSRIGSGTTIDIRWAVSDNLLNG